MKQIYDFYLDVFTEATKKTPTLLVLYPGRFQPMGLHHKKVYDWMQRKFGKSNTAVISSGKIDPIRSPFSFQEKKKIAKMLGINKFTQVKQPYKPDTFLPDTKLATTTIIFVVGEKDANRLNSGKYFRPWKGKAEVTADEGAYVAIAPDINIKLPNGKMSGTALRQFFGDSSVPESEKQKVFKALYGTWNKSVFNMIVNKLTKVHESVMRYASTLDVSFLTENKITGMNAGEVDDGPTMFIKNTAGFKNMGNSMAQSIGYEVINWLIPNIEFDIRDTEYPNGPVSSVTFFPAGVAGKTTTVNQIDLVGKPAYSKWLQHISANAAFVGYTFVDKMKDSEAIEQSLHEPNVATTLSLFSEGWWKDQLISDVKTSPSDTRELLLCGGAAGHMLKPFENMDMTFSELKSLIELGLAGKLDVEDSVLEKCIHGDSIVTLENHGDLKISDVVDNNIKDNILSFNEDTMENEYLQINELFNNDTTCDWIEIILEDDVILKVTSNHKIFTLNRGYVLASNLTIDDELQINS